MWTSCFGEAVHAIDGSSSSVQLKFAKQEHNDAKNYEHKRNGEA
jgi:hypothetical protein